MGNAGSCSGRRSVTVSVNKQEPEAEGSVNHTITLKNIEDDLVKSPVLSEAPSSSPVNAEEKTDTQKHTEDSKEECGICLDDFLESELHKQVCGDKCPVSACKSCLNQHFETIIHSGFDGICPRMKCPACPRITPFDKWKSITSTELSDLFVRRAQILLSFQCASCHSRKNLMVEPGDLDEAAAAAFDAHLAALAPEAKLAYEAALAGFEAGAADADAGRVLDALAAAFPPAAAAAAAEEEDAAAATFWERAVRPALARVADPERRALLHLRFLRRAPRVRTKCCRADQCFRCRTRAWHAGRTCAQVQAELYKDDTVVSCERCGVALVKGDGCSSVTCVCGHNFDWDARKRAAVVAAWEAQHGGAAGAARAAALALWRPEEFDADHLARARAWSSAASPAAVGAGRAALWAELHGPHAAAAAVAVAEGQEARRGLRDPGGARTLALAWRDQAAAHGAAFAAAAAARAGLPARAWGALVRRGFPVSLLGRPLSKERYFVTKRPGEGARIRVDKEMDSPIAGYVPKGVVVTIAEEVKLQFPKNKVRIRIIAPKEYVGWMTLNSHLCEEVPTDPGAALPFLSQDPALRRWVQARAHGDGLQRDADARARARRVRCWRALYGPGPAVVERHLAPAAAAPGLPPGHREFLAAASAFGRHRVHADVAAAAAFAGAHPADPLGAALALVDRAAAASPPGRGGGGEELAGARALLDARRWALRRRLARRWAARHGAAVGGDGGIIGPAAAVAHAAAAAFFEGERRAAAARAARAVAARVAAGARRRRPAAAPAGAGRGDLLAAIREGTHLTSLRRVNGAEESRRARRAWAKVRAVTRAVRGFGGLRPRTAQPSNSSPGRRGEEDRGPLDTWACPQCDNLNWVKRTQCNCCPFRVEEDEGETKFGEGDGPIRPGDGDGGAPSPNAYAWLLFTRAAPPPGARAASEADAAAVQARAWAHVHRHALAEHTERAQRAVLRAAAALLAPAGSLGRDRPLLGAGLGKFGFSGPAAAALRGSRGALFAGRTEEERRAQGFRGLYGNRGLTSVAAVHTHLYEAWKKTCASPDAKVVLGMIARGVPADKLNAALRVGAREFLCKAAEQRKAAERSVKEIFPIAEATEEEEEKGEVLPAVEDSTTVTIKQEPLTFFDLENTLHAALGLPNTLYQPEEAPKEINRALPLKVIKQLYIGVPHQAVMNNIEREGITKEDGKAWTLEELFLEMDWEELKDETTCPGRHGLSDFPTPSQMWYCSRCYSKTGKQTGHPKGSTFYGCRACDFDLCRVCYEELESAKAHRRRELVFSPRSLGHPVAAAAALEARRRELGGLPEEEPEMVGGAAARMVVEDMLKLRLLQAR